MREKSVFLSDLEKSKEFFTEIRIAVLSPRRISAPDRLALKHDAGVNSHSTTAFAQGNAAQSRHGVRGKDTGQGGRGHGSEKTKACQSGTLLRKTYPPLSEGGGDQSGAMSSNDV